MLRKVKFMLALALTIPLTYFGACQTSDIMDMAPQEAVTLEFWHCYAQEQQETLENLLETFEQTVGKEKGIAVRSRSFGSIDDLTIAVAVSSQRGHFPDLFSSYPDTAWDLAQDERLVDLTEYFSDADLQIFSESSLQAGQLRGQEALHHLPLATSSEIIMINATAYEAFAAEKPEYADAESVFATFESILDAATAYHQWSGKPMFGFDSLANFAVAGHRQLGVELFQDQNGKAGLELDRQVMRRVWELHYEGTIQGGFSSVGRYRSEDLFTQDLIAAVVSTAAGPYLSSQTIDAKGQLQDIQLKALPYPVFEDGQPVSVRQGAGVSIMRSDPDREIAAAVLLHWLTRPEQNVLFTLPSGYLPVTQPALQSQLLQDHLSRFESIWPQRQAVSCCLNVFLEQTETHEIYAPAAFENSYSIRGLLSHAMDQHARQAREAYLEDQAKGLSSSQLRDKYINDAVFEAWYSKLIQDVDPLLP